MAITTLAELKTAVGTYMNRSDFSASVLTELVALAEARLNRELPLRVNWTTSSPTGTVGLRTLALATSPAYVEGIALFLTTYSPKHIRLTKRANGTIEYLTSNGVPKEWCVVGTNIELDRPCDQAHTFRFVYRQAFNLATTDPNWLLTNHSDIYLNACLLEASLLTKNQEFGAACKAKLDEGVMELRRLDGKNNNATLVADYALRGRGGYYDGANDASV